MWLFDYIKCIRNPFKIDVNFILSNKQKKHFEEIVKCIEYNKFSTFNIIVWTHH